MKKANALAGSAEDDNPRFCLANPGKHDLVHLLSAVQPKPIWPERGDPSP